MAKYSDIKGFTVQTLSTDTIASQFAGGSWASGGSMNTARRRVLGSGIQTAAIAVAGYSTAAQALAEQYNGSSWTEVADLNTQRDSGGMSGLAPYTATIYFGGGNSPGGNTGASESFDGSSWTEVADLNTGRNMAFGMGASSTAALGGGGETPPVVATVEKYDGSSWTEVGDLNTARAFAAGTGSNTAAIVFGGEPPFLANAEQWNGSAWTEVGDLNTARSGLAGSGSTYTDALAFGGGAPTAAAVTEHFDGSSWTEIADLSTARGGGPMGAGTSALSIAAGGNNPGGNLASTEEWTAPATFNQIQEGQLFFNSTTNTFKETLTDIPGGTWSSGGTMNNDERYFSGGAGIKTAAIAFGGDSPQINKTESYNGTSWTEVNNLNTTKNYVSGAGTYTAALCINGYQNPPNVDLNQVESWDGTNWTEITETNETANAGNVSCGTQTAALITMRSPSPIAGRTELWNGSAWTETTDLNTARPNGAVFGISTSSLASGGSPGATYTQAESWDGSAWTEVGDLNLGRQSLGSAGANNLSGIVFAGNRPGASSPAPGYTEAQRTEFWNGTSWTEINDMSTDRAGGSSSKSGGSATSAHAAGGNAPPYTGVTEEWTVDLANKTITAS
jgi:hypothetical protein